MNRRGMVTRTLTVYHGIATVFDTESKTTKEVPFSIANKPKEKRVIAEVSAVLSLPPTQKVVFVDNWTETSGVYGMSESEFTANAKKLD